MTDTTVTLHLGLDDTDVQKKLDILEHQKCEMPAHVTMDTSATEQAVQAVDTAQQQIQAILADGALSDKSRAMAIAQVYRQGGMEMSDALKKAWEIVKGSAANATEDMQTSAERAGDAVRKSLNEPLADTQKAAGKAASGLQETTAGAKQASDGMQRTEKSANALNLTAGKLAATLGSVFAVGKILSWSKSCITASTDTSNALQGLQSILNGQGRSFSDASGFIDAYISDGLVPLTNAVTAYKNLASRGYDDSQIQNVLTALKDSAAYGRQASYSLGEAVASATEGLKNENSILVDNAGVTKNVSKMWEDYAKSIGVSSTALTQEQKIQAEVNGILQETQFQTGDAAKIAGSFSGKISQLNASFNALKTAVGNILTGAIAPYIGYVNAAVRATTNLIAKIGTFLGISGDTAASFAGMQVQSAASNVDNLARSYENAAEAAKMLSSASFDDFNVIGSQGIDTETGTAEGSTGTEAIQKAADSTEEVTSQVNTLLEKLKQSPVVTAFWTGFQRQISKVDTSAIVTNFKRSFDALQPIAAAATAGTLAVITAFSGAAGTYFGGIASLAGKGIEVASGGIALFLENENGNIAAWTTETSNTIADGFNNMEISFDYIFDALYAGMEDAQPTLEQGVSDMLTGMTDLGMGVGTILADMFAATTAEISQFVQEQSEEIEDASAGTSEVLGQFMSLVGEVTGGAASVLDKFWKETGKPLYENICGVISDIGEFALKLYNKWVVPIAKKIADELLRLWESAIQPLWENVLDFFGSIGEALVANWNLYAKPFLSWIEQSIVPVVENVAEVVVSILGTVFEVVIDVISGALEFCTGLIDFLTGIFTLDFDKALEGIRGMMVGFGNAVIAVVAGACNLIIDGINLLLALCFDGIGGLIGTVLSVADQIGGWLGMDWNLSFPAEPPQLPRMEIPLQFAKGAIVHQPTLAMVGDNPNARHDPEVISPLSKLKDIIGSTSQQAGMPEQEMCEIIEILKMILEAIGNINPTFRIGDKEIYAAAKRGKQRYDRMKGVTNAQKI